MTDELDVVRAWHAALNAGSVDELLSLSTPDVEVGGPRGVGKGADLLRDWFGRANVGLEPTDYVRRNGAVVVEQQAQWRAENGDLGEPQTVASVFRVRDGLVASVIRYPDMAAALAAVEPSSKSEAV